MSGRGIATAGGRSGDGPNDASPFIKRDRMRRNFMRNRRRIIKKEDPDDQEAKDQLMLMGGVEGVKNEDGSIKPKLEQPLPKAKDTYNEFPLRAVSRESLENMRTHLLKFQSKKKIHPTEDFHLPVRLHRKDTRNLQFQLTRAEIVQRQKEIADYKNSQEGAQRSSFSNNNNNNYKKPGSVEPKSLNDTSANANANASVNSTASGTPGPIVSGTPGAVVSGTPGVTATPAVASGSAIGTPTNTATATATTTSTAATTNGVSATPGAPGTVATVPGASPGAPASGLPLVPGATILEDAGPAEDPTKVGLVKYDGKEMDLSELADGPTVDPMADVAPDGGGRAKRGGSRRKTRQLKVLDENAKKLRFEEFYPWVMEDFDGYNTWVGSYEAGNSDSYVLLSVEDDGSFTMIPADKVYKFTARNKYATLTIEEAEKRMDKKSGEVPRWLMKHLDNIGTTTTRYDRTRRKLKAVSDQRTGEDDYDHSDNSEVELDYDEEFADDEEAPIIDGNEQENKESEERIKKEMLQANAMGLRDDEHISEDDESELFGEKKIDEEGERIKKALQKTELAALYSSDEDEINPYLSESEEEKEEEEKKEGSEEPQAKKSPKKQDYKSRQGTPSLKEPSLRIKSIKDCIIVLKGKKSALQNFPPGVWNPEVTNRKRTIDEVTVKAEPSTGSVASKKLKTENDSIPLITEQDIINAIGDGKVNVKEFGKRIRKMYPGPENKKLMFTLVKKLCRKVDDEHMELKK
ncbi:Transcription initiation factor IIF subunit alpha [Nakaseomyces bracarensis]|uniref:Transcription initiation factor IIF subunit alpha n=1 Tax=Nakaseomyces bracarensis TaxID=273131 RepID=A0ABR4P0R7_9SACH